MMVAVVAVRRWWRCVGPSSVYAYSGLPRLLIELQQQVKHSLWGSKIEHMPFMAAWRRVMVQERC